MYSQLTLNEFNRILEFIKWGVEKKGLKDPDFVSAYDKLKSVVDNEASNYFIGSKNNSAYEKLSDKAKAYIAKRVENNYPNTYNSVYACLNYYHKAGTKISKKGLRGGYIQKYDIANEDMDVFDEIFNAAIESFEATRKIKLDD